jgi:DNA gyrase/topoisomerase IV subunit A
MINILKHQIFLQVVIYGYEGVREAFKTGRGRVVMRAKVGFEEVEGREYYRY